MSERIAIIAGKGSLPVELAQGLMARNEPPFLIGIEGETGGWITRHEHAVLGWGQFGELFKLLKQNGCNRVVLAGGVTRPRINIAKMDWGAIRSLPDILAFMIGGDNSLLSGVINLFEKRGFVVVGAHQIMPELLAGSGVVSGKKPPRKAMTNITRAVEAAKLLGQLDIGQAAVAVGGRVVAVEAIEGTDGMLERCANMRHSGRLYENGRFGVLVKTMKPGQEMRVDLPAIGPGTIEMLDDAGLRGVAIEAGRSFILEREKTLQLARKRDIFIFGIEPIDGVAR